MSADPQAIADAIDHLITTKLMVEKHLLYDSAVIKAKADLVAALRDIASEPNVLGPQRDDTKPSRFMPGDRIVCVVDHINLEKGRVYIVQPPRWPGHEDGKVTVEGNFGHIGCEDCPFPDEYFELVCGVSIIA